MNSFHRWAGSVAVVLALSQSAWGFGRGGGAVGASRGGGYATRGGSGNFQNSAHRGNTAFGGSYGGFDRSGSYTTNRGGSVDYDRYGGAYRGPRGGTAVGGGRDVDVTTAGGRTYDGSTQRGAAVGPGGGMAAGREHSATASGPGGTVAGGSRGGVAVGPYGGVAAGRERGGAAVGTGGSAAAGWERGGVAIGGNRGGAAWSHSTTYRTPNAVVNQSLAVRSVNYGYFNRGWYGSHPGAWTATRWYGGGYWVVPAWPTLSVYCGVAAAPIEYDYGTSVVINNNTVYQNGETIAPAPQYAEQAITIANAGRSDSPPAATDEWQALGVFGLVQGEETVANQVVQLAVNKAGTVKGNYYDALSDATQPVFGSVDKKSQRVAWSVGERKDVVYEAGLANLAKDEVPVLVHFGKDRTRQLTLVRLPEQK